MKLLILLTVTIFSLTSFATNNEFEFEISGSDKNSNIVKNINFDATEWLNSFPNTNNSRGKISKTFIITDDLMVTVNYYSAGEKKFAVAPGNKHFNIFDFSVHSADNSKTYCYNSIYTLSLAQIPYLLQTCNLPSDGKVQNIRLTYSSNLFW